MSAAGTMRRSAGKGVSFGTGAEEDYSTPDIVESVAIPASVDQTEEELEVNPFAVPLPTFDEISEYQRKEREERAEHLRNQSSLKVYEKSSSRQRRVKIPQDSDVTVTISDMAAVHSSKAQNLAISTRDRHVEKEDLSDYIQKKRDMFLVQYALEVKRQEIDKLEKHAAEEEKLIEAAEAQLEADGKKFYEFLKENDRSSSEAVQQAEAQEKVNADKDAEIKALDSEIQTLQSTVSKHEDRQKELDVCIDFLDSLAPKDWLRSRDATFNSDQAVEFKPYFASPQDLLKVFSELEGHNLSLITNGQEVEESLQDLEDRVQEEQRLMREEESEAARKNAELEAMIEHESELSWFAKERTTYFSSSNSEKQEEELAALETKVAAVYVECIGENEANISALQMLTNIENKLEELFEMIAKMPPDQVEAAEKAKEKQRRIRAREEKLEAQRLHQEERVRKALERAQAAPKVQTTKKLMYRSAPPKVKKPNSNRKLAASVEEEENRYFFGEQ